MEWPDTASQPAGYWGKLDREEATWHPVVDHSADVAACAEALLTRTLLGQRLAKLAGRSELTQADVAWLSLAAGLHDIGKFNNGFQRKAVPNAPDTAGHVSPATPPPTRR